MSIEWDIDWDESFGDPSEGELLDEEEAGKIILERLNVDWSELDAVLKTLDGNEVYFQGVNHRNLARNLAALIPAEQRTEMMLRRVDVRALLNEMMATSGDKGDTVVGGVEFTSKERDAAAILYGDYTRRVAAELQSEMVGMGTDPTQAASIAQEQATFVPGTLRPVSLASITPMTYGEELAAEADLRVRTEDGGTRTEASSNSAFNVDLSGLLGGTEIERPAFMTQADIDILFNTASADEAIQAYLREQSQRRAFDDQRSQAIEQGMDPGAALLAPSDDLRLQYRQERGTFTGPGTFAQVPAGQEAPTRYQGYTITQALQLPNTMSRTELAQLTDRMVDAGFLEEGSVIKGNPTDPTFKRAWRNLMSQAVQQDRPMWELLGESINMRESARKAARESFQAKLSDPSTIRLTTQALARQIIGRKISDEEAQRLVEMVHQWEKDAQFAEMEATTGETTGADGDIMNVDWQSRMEELIRNENPDEAEAKEQVNQYESFRTMIGGPGYGPTRRGVLS